MGHKTSHFRINVAQWDHAILQKMGWKMSMSMDMIIWWYWANRCFTTLWFQWSCYWGINLYGNITTRMKLLNCSTNTEHWWEWFHGKFWRILKKLVWTNHSKAMTWLKQCKRTLKVIKSLGPMLWNPRQSKYNGKKGKQEILVSKQWFFIMLFHNVNYLDPQTLSLDLPLTWKSKVKKIQVLTL